MEFKLANYIKISGNALEIACTEPENKSHEFGEGGALACVFRTNSSLILFDVSAHVPSPYCFYIEPFLPSLFSYPHQTSLF